MSFAVDYRVGSTWYSLNNRDPFRWLDDNGLGAAQIEEIVERGAAQHGQTRLDYRLLPRTIMGAIGFLADDESDYWDRRSLLVNTLFAPSNAVNALRFTLDNGDVRQIDVRFRGDLQLAFRERSHTWHRSVVSLSTDDPSFYDPTAVNVLFQLTDPGGGWQVPMAIPWNISPEIINQTTVITYPGGWNSLPLLRLFGPITGPIISNTITRTDTGEDETATLDFTGTTIASGDYFEIDLRGGNKTVVDSSGTNRINTLTDDSDLDTFKIYRALEAAGGTNTIRAQGSSVTSTTLLQLVYYNRYLGI